MATTSDLLAEWRAKEQAATGGPWGHYTPGGMYEHLDPIFGAIPGDEVALVHRRADHRFIADARTTVPALLSAVEAVLALADEFNSRLPDGTGNGRAYNAYTVARRIQAVISAALGTEEGE